ncbi:MAG: 3-hydroxyacyl-CoA dehydrogenase NAD-binding domain-containing protein [Cyclobacteriaceae bacterium]
MKTIAVVGSGTMGSGIAHTFSQHGFHVQLIDNQIQALEAAVASIEKNLLRQKKKGLLDQGSGAEILKRIKITNALEEGVQEADLVVEAIVEDFDAKAALFIQLDNFCASKCILASNTSSISIGKIGACTQRPDKIIGMHFMNPVPIMPLVEVIASIKTSPETIHIIKAVSESIGKTPLLVKDYPGFIANRILMPMINEAIISLNEGVADVETIDQIMKMGMAHPMGPLELADYIGLDVCLSILSVLEKGFGSSKYAPSPLLVNMVNSGFTGVKSGEGFYRYIPGTKEKAVSERFKPNH